MTKPKFPKPLVIFTWFTLLSGGFAYFLIYFRLPESLLLLMTAPLLWSTIYYPRKLTLFLLIILVAAQGWVIYSLSPNYSYSIITLTATLAALTFSFFLINNLIHKYNAENEENNEQYRIVANYPHALEFWMKPDGSLAYVSPSCKQITGYSQNDFIQRPNLFYDIILPEDRQQVLAEQARVRKKNEDIPTMEYRIKPREGQQHWVEYSSRQVYSDTGEYLGKRGSIYDITERKAVAEEFKARAERLTLALEGARDGVWDVDLVTGHSYFSPNYASALGLKPDQPYIKLQDLYDLIHPEDLSHMLDAFKAHLRGNVQSYQSEYRLKNKESGWRWVLDRGKIIQRSPSGKPLRMIGTHVDITDRKKIEEALQQSETKFKQLAENMREVFWLRDRNHRNFIYVSPAFTNIWGHNVEKLYENPNLFIESIHPEDLGRVVHALKELTEKGTIMNEEFRVVHPDSTIRWVWSRAYPIYDEGKQYYRIAGIVEDTTERKQIDNSLKESEKRYRDLIEQQGGGVAIIDPNDRIVYINPAGEDIYGVTRGRLSGRNLKEFLEDDQLNVLQGQSTLRRQGIESTFEITITRPDSEKRSLLITATPRFDVNNQFLGTIAIFRDNSQNKMTEERLLYISLHDALTDLHNRAYFEEEINRLNESFTGSVGVIMVDVDGLKVVNDSYGHSQGDQLLLRVSSILKATVRNGDIVSRLGGDEFAVLLPNTDEKTLQQVMNRLFENVAEENKKVNTPNPVSLSAGGMVCYQHGMLKQAMEEADARMYRAKEQKKNNYFINLPMRQ